MEVAIEGLKLVSNAGTENDNDENGGTPNKGGNSGIPSGGNKDIGKDAPKTGDEIPFILLVAIVLSLGVIRCSLQRKK